MANIYRLGAIGFAVLGRHDGVVVIDEDICEVPGDAVV